MSAPNDLLTFDGQVDMMRFDSSNLHSGLYDVLSQNLYIRFHNKPVDSIYVYLGVPHSVWKGLKTASSHGSYHYHNIRMAYPYERLTLSDWPQQGRGVDSAVVRRFLTAAL